MRNESGFPVVCCWGLEFRLLVSLQLVLLQLVLLKLVLLKLVLLKLVEECSGE